MLSAARRGDRTIPEVGGLSGVGATSVNEVLRLHRAGVDLAPRPRGGGHTPRLGARRRRSLRPAVASNDDAALGELREQLEARAGVTVSGATVSRAPRRLGPPRKKKHEGGGA